MVHDDERVATIDDLTGEGEAPAAEPRAGSRAGRALLFGGVAGACALGAGLGLWARPSDLEHPAAAKTVQTAVLTAQPRRIPIVVDDTPAPVGKPMDVLAASPPRPAVAPPRRQPEPQPELMAPARPPNGLVRVAAAVVGPIVSARPHTLLPPVAPPAAEPVAPPAKAASKPQAKPAAARAAAAKLIQAQIDRTRADEAKKARALKLAQAREAKAEHAREVAEEAAEARAEAKAERLAKLKARREKAAHAREVELAKAAPPPPKPHGLKALIAKLAPHHARPEPEAPPPAKLAKAAPRTSRCASPDPGEALACGDPSLSAADRRLARAYRDAEAAGVPAATLASQQTRWKAARAAAAREAPWAVREVYQARIAELQDLARDAQGN